MDTPFERYQAALQKGHRAVIDGRPREALKHYSEAAALADTRPLPHVCIGGVLLGTGQVEEALAAYERALALAPNDRAAIDGKAAALLAAGRSDDAAAMTGRLADAEQANDRERRDAAMAAALREAERAGTSARPEVLHIYAEQAMVAQRPQAAIEAWLESARLFAEAGQLDAALDSAQRALLTAPGETRVHLELSRLYLLRGWPDRAGERLKLLDQLLDLQPDDELRSAARALAAENATADPRLRALAGSTDNPH